MAQAREIALFRNKAYGGDGNRHNARHDVDEEQPVPGGRLGDPAADDRTESRGEHCYHAGDGGRKGLAAARKEQEDGGEDEWNENATGETLDDARRDQ